MKMKHRVSLISLACLASAQLAHAAPRYDQTGNFYIPLSVGQYFPDSSLNERSSFTAGIGLGYNINNYFAVQTNLFGFGPVNRTTGREVTGYNWDLEGRVNLANSSPIMPYLVLGAGALKNTNAQIALDYGVGVDYLMAHNLSFGVSFRQAYQFVGSKANNFGLANVTWTFGSEPVSPVVAAAPIVTQAVVVTQQTMLKKAQASLKPILPNGVFLCKGNIAGDEAGCVTFNGNIMTMHLNVRFLQNKAGIQSQYGTPIQSVGNFMHAYPDTKVTLYGYASSEGRLAFNQALSMKRALQVKGYLVHGSHINPSRISVVAMGVKNPIESNKTKAGRQANRRVETEIPVPARLLQ
ncbi:MAG: OmpA family protein [Gammaproteobacteria bacterium]|nr:OmpA family protein [Gammaproteobacteria bacterium]